MLIIISYNYNKEDRIIIKVLWVVKKIIEIIKIDIGKKIK